MDRACGDIAVWTDLLQSENAALLDAIATSDPQAAAVMSRLRKRWSIETIAAAIELVKARRKARTKFPNADAIVADVAGVEQASGRRVADHKSARFRAAAAPRVLDLCCGIGGDAMSLASATESLVAVDHDALRAWMAGRNAGCDTRVADVTTVPAPDAFFHIDPDRRSAGGRRLRRFEDYRPGPSVIGRLIGESPGGAVKLGPGVEFETLPLTGTTEIEVISDGGTLVQAVLWSGRLATSPGERTATRLPDGATLTGVPCPTPVRGAADRYLLAVDPAIERTRLVGVLCERTGLEAMHPALGLLTASALPTTEPATAWLTPYELVEEMPWRLKNVKGWLAERGAGVVTVKTRGGAVETDRAQRQLRGRGDVPFTVFILRVDQKVRALVTRRASCASAGPASGPA